MDEHATEEALQAEILDLERRLKDAKARLPRPPAPTVLTGSGPRNDLCTLAAVQLLQIRGLQTDYPFSNTPLPGYSFSSPFV
jgi:hypothetical protein